MTTPRYSTKRLIMDYLKYGPVPSPTTRIVRYMIVMHKCTAGAVRKQLYDLVRHGAIERAGLHHYRLVEAA